MKTIPEIWLTSELVNRTLLARERLNQKGMKFTRNKKGKKGEIIDFKIIYSMW